MDKNDALETIITLAKAWATATKGDVAVAFQIIASTAEGAVEHSVQADRASRPRCTVCGTTNHHIDSKGRVVPNPPRR